ncbi:hypothetical protein THIOM_000197 [Candidatus Thiomargarita nelsonii]|uniref:Uncharacterized protein n=1 Tax=Candidatus Thiomargarita nelsonii TaxID=1003181 RepID=A0A176S7E8_9GAMM|nr:hypothetical protein THIOM_000197 [Candidatus Thiomargarita nelsonii]
MYGFAAFGVCNPVGNVFIATAYDVRAGCKPALARKMTKCLTVRLTAQTLTSSSTEIAVKDSSK